MDKPSFIKKPVNEAVHQAHADSEHENFEKEQRKPVVDMLKRSIPGFTEWGNTVLSTKSPSDAIEELQKFTNDVYALPDDLQDSWSLSASGAYSGIHFSNPANGRQFEIQYSIVEMDAPKQDFIKPAARKKIKGVAVANTWNISSFSR